MHRMGRSGTGAGPGPVPLLSSYFGDSGPAQRPGSLRAQVEPSRLRRRQARAARWARQPPCGADVGCVVYRWASAVKPGTVEPSSSRTDRSRAEVQCRPRAGVPVRPVPPRARRRCPPRAVAGVEQAGARERGPQAAPCGSPGPFAPAGEGASLPRSGPGSGAARTGGRHTRQAGNVPEAAASDRCPAHRAAPRPGRATGVCEGGRQQLDPERQPVTDACRQGAPPHRGRGGWPCWCRSPACC